MPIDGARGTAVKIGLACLIDAKTCSRKRLAEFRAALRMSAERARDRGDGLGDLGVHALLFQSLVIEPAKKQRPDHIARLPPLDELRKDLHLGSNGSVEVLRK